MSLKLFDQLSSILCKDFRSFVGFAFGRLRNSLLGIPTHIGELINSYILVSAYFKTLLSNTFRLISSQVDPTPILIISIKKLTLNTQESPKIVSKMDPT
jgi:hypothetical protein